MVDREKVYIETTIVSYYTGRPSRDLVIAGRQEVTRETWELIAGTFDRYISELVLNEISQGDPQYAQRRLASIVGIPVLGITDEAIRLAGHLVKCNAIAKDFPEDALHIALSAANGVDFLLTWNFSHINNAQMKYRITKVVEEHGLMCPVICTPDELIGG
jgi:predicted nucleic acid-binding protein